MTQCPRHFRERENPATSAAHFWVPASAGTTMVTGRGVLLSQIRNDSCSFFPGWGQPLRYIWTDDKKLAHGVN